MAAITSKERSTIERALVYLASCCHGVGFNDFDSQFGKSLAEQVEDGRSLPKAQLESARKMLVKYRVQLKDAGFSIDDVEGIARSRPGTWADNDRSTVQDAIVVAAKSAAGIASVLAIPAIEPRNEVGDLRSALSENQRQGFDMALQWFGAGTSTPFVLRGHAGTGKSFGAQSIVRALQILNPRLRVALCAPTHKARKVLQRFAVNAGLNAYVATLHSLLHVIPGKPDENGKRRLEPNRFSCEPHYSSFGLVVVDEASMVDDELLSLVLKEQIATIFMGDPAQLPPVVEGDDSQAKESPVFAIGTGIELTQVMRYEGAIADHVTAIRSDLRSQFPPRIQSRGNISKLTPERWMEGLLDALVNQPSGSDSDRVRALAWTNKRVADINAQVRSALFPNASEPYLPGELLMAKDSIQVMDDKGRPRTFMHSCQECNVVSVEAKSTMVGCSRLGGALKVSAYVLGVESDMEDQAWLTIVHPEAWASVQAYMNKAKKEILASPQNERSGLWREWYELCNDLNVTMRGNTMLNKLQYAYALTVHQSQGSTFAHTFVDTLNIMGCRDVKLRNQLLYVACSRASEHLYVSAKF